MHQHTIIVFSCGVDNGQFFDERTALATSLGGSQPPRSRNCRDSAKKGAEEKFPKGFYSSFLVEREMCIFAESD